MRKVKKVKAYQSSVIKLAKKLLQSVQIFAWLSPTSHFVHSLVLNRICFLHRPNVMSGLCDDLVQRIQVIHSVRGLQSNSVVSFQQTDVNRQTFRAQISERIQLKVFVIQVLYQVFQLRFVCVAEEDSD
jgi:hypothetical protein